jgi:transcriptional regulator with XRE-family HTH domain
MEVNASLIKNQRSINGRTQQHLADACGVSLRTIQRVERYGQASNETVASLSSVFEIHSQDIIETLEQKEEIEVQAVKNFWFSSSHVIGYFCGLASGLLVSFLAYIG